MGGKYRTNKIKREHTIIEDIHELLEDVALLPGVKSIIPGRIHRRSGSGIRPRLRINYRTSSGYKMLAKNSSSLQEIFLVTDEPEEVGSALQKKEYFEGQIP